MASFPIALDSDQIAQLQFKENEMIFDIEVVIPKPYAQRIYGITCDIIILDELGDFNLFKQVTPDWKQTTFVSGPPTPPDAAKRAKLRAKRKK
jgi:hypothetical protein